MLTAGTLRACWSVGLAFVGPGAAGLVLVIAVELGLITCMGVFNPVFATYRLEQTATDRVARTLSAWSVTSNATIAAMTALWGLLAERHRPPRRDRGRRGPPAGDPAPAPAPGSRGPGAGHPQVMAGQVRPRWPPRLRRARAQPPRLGEARAAASRSWG